MEKFKPGNIISNKIGHLAIFEEYFENKDGKKLFKWESLECKDSSGITEVEKVVRTVSCSCHFDNWVRTPNPELDYTVPESDCPDCGGTGYYKITDRGEEDWELIANNEREYNQAKAIQKIKSIFSEAELETLKKEALSDVEDTFESGWNAFKKIIFN